MIEYKKSQNFNILRTKEIGAFAPIFYKAMLANFVINNITYFVIII